MPETIPSELPQFVLPKGTPPPGRTSNLAFALRCLPKETRSDMLVFYQFCRLVDDVADSTNFSAATRHWLLRPWLEAANGLRPFPEDLAAVISRHQVSLEYLRAIIEGVTSDIERPRFPTFTDLKNYCWQVAGAVGLASNQITGCISPQSSTYAENLGYALQLTNILRDIAEDAKAGRIYLPSDLLEKYGVSDNEIFHQQPTKPLVALLQAVGIQAEHYFLQVATGAPKEDQGALKAAEAMRKIYYLLYTKMKRDGFQVFQKKYKVSRFQKLRILLPFLLPSHALRRSSK